MAIEIKYFGMLTGITGKSSEAVEVQPDLEGMMKLLKEMHPGLSVVRFSVSLNQRLVHDNPKLSDGDEIALLPPFAGG